MARLDLRREFGLSKMQHFAMPTDGHNNKWVTVWSVKHLRRCAMGNKLHQLSCGRTIWWFLFHRCLLSRDATTVQPNFHKKPRRSGYPGLP